MRKLRKNKINHNGKIKEKNKMPLGKKILIIVLAFIILIIVSIALFMVYIALSAGKFDPNKLVSQDQSVVYDSEGNVMATLGLEKRESVKYEELPQVLVDAIIATEDSRFFQHNGVDMARFMKASFYQLLGHSDAGGASTLTMQVSKNNLTNTNSSGIKGIIRKFQDVYISVFQIEKKYTKEEIIEYYVNDNGLGGRIYGVGQASQYYFGKSVGELSLPEAALLAGMFQAPNTYNPYKNPEKAAERRATVLKLMVRHGYITKEEADLANKVDISSMLVGVKDEANGYQGFIDTVVSEIEEKTGDNPYSVAMKVYTTMDKKIQDGINNVLDGKETDFKWEDDKIQSGIAVTDVNTGAIVAIGAGRNREQGWNYATQARRQPGSTAKPLFDYGPGFEYNNYSTYTLFNDEPWSYSGGVEVGNWDSSYEGLITLRRALSVSRNIPALKAFQQVDKKNIVQFVNGLGLDIAYSTSSENYKKYDNGADNLLNEAYAIGGMSYGVTPLDMSAAYAAFASGGYYTKPYSVKKIEYRSTGETKEFKEEKKKAMSDSTAYLMNNVLKYAVDYGFNGGAKVAGSTVAAKTGTSNLDSKTIERLGLPNGAVNDLWTVAYTPEYSIALWYGYETVSKEHYLAGASAPKDTVMRSVMKYIPKTTKEFSMPSSVVASSVEKETWPAQLPSDNTPNDLKLTEYFKKGTQPTEVSPRFSSLNNVSNLKATITGRKVNLTWDYSEPEVNTKSYLEKYFSQSAFGNGTSTFVNNRLNYINNTMGGIGFGIYEKEANGNLKLIQFVTDKKYTYNPPYMASSRDTTFVVKTQYKNWSNLSSSGVEVKATIGAGGTDPNNNNNNNQQTEDTLVIELTPNPATAKVHEYTEGTHIIKLNNTNITNKVSSIKYTLNNKDYTSSSDLEDAVNELDAGTYSIIYTIEYNNKTATATREIELTEE